MFTRPSRRLALILLSVFLLSLCLPACAESNPPAKKATVMIYMCGADLDQLERSAATSHLSEINGLGFNRDEINVVVLQGGARQWKSKLDPSVLHVSECGGRRTKEVKSLPLSSMGSPDTLSAFLNDCASAYPADRFYLIIWDHGGGPNLGVCVDALFDPDTLTVNELSSALAASVFADRGLEIIAFNTCLTGTIEYAAALSPFAKYMVATEDSMFGLSYDWIKTLDHESDPLEIAMRIVDGTFERNRESIKAQHASEINSVAAIDLNHVAPVLESMDRFFAEVRPNVSETNFSRMSAQRRSSVTFGVTESGGNRDYDMADLGSLVSNLREYAPEQADALLSALDEAVAYKRTVDDHCYGATVYHPLVNLGKMEDFMSVHNGIPLSENYSAYIQQFAAILTGTPLAKWTGLTADAAVTKANRSQFNLALTEEQTAQLSDADLVMLEKQPDDSYRFIGLNRYVPLKENVLTGEYTGTALYAVRGGEIISPPLAYDIGNSGTWLIPATVTVGDVTLHGLIQCDPDPVSEILSPGGILVWQEGLGMYSSGYNLSFADCSEVSLPLVTRTPARDENGVLRRFEDWDPASETVWTLPVDGSWQFALLHDTVDPESLYAAFQVQDTQSNLYSSELVAAKGGNVSVGDAVVSYEDKDLLTIDRLSVSRQQENLVLSAEVTSLGKTEVIFRLADLALNGQPVEASAEITGNGENWGLLEGESQLMSLLLPLSSLPVSGSLTDLSFSLQVLDAETEEELDAIPVSVQVALPLSTQLSS